MSDVPLDISFEVSELMDRRNAARDAKNWAEADAILKFISDKYDLAIEDSVVVDAAGIKTNRSECRTKNDVLNAKKRKTECMRHDQRIRHLESKLGRAVSVSEAATVPRKRRITNAARNKHKLKQKARFPAFANWLRFKFKLRPGMHVLDVAG
jgi:hypothetical protein